MTTGDDTIVRRYAEAMERRGEQIVLRRMSGASGAENPPTLVNPRLALDVAAGATSIGIDADQANGMIVAGDTIAIGTAQPVTVTVNVTSRETIDTPGFDAVPVSAVPQAAVAGTPLFMAWQADQLVWAYVQSFPIALQADQRLAGDWNVIIAAYGVAQPQPIDELQIDGFARQVISVDRMRQRGQTVGWMVHAR